MTESKIKPASDAEIVVWGQLHGITSMSHHALIARITAEKALREELVAGVRDTLDYLWNPFEPDNQSTQWKSLKMLLARAEQFEKEVSQ